MKLTFVLMLTTFLQLSAATYAQKITINKKQASLKEIFSIIHKQSNYNVLYNSEMLKNAKPVDLVLKDATIKDVMDICIDHQTIDYDIIDNTIVIKEKVQAKASQQKEITINGKVTNIKGSALPGVNIIVKGTALGATTDINGKYTIKVPGSTSILVFSFVGFATKEVTVNNQTAIDVILIEESNSLSDVVVIGYGTQKKGDLNGSISSISAKDIANSPQVGIDQMLQGKVSGVTITQNSGAPGSNTSVHIRGITSLSGSNEPLYVIDGVPISGDATNQTTSGRSPLQSSGAAGGNADAQTSVSPLSLINPNDIESINVLKDASATAIYGSRASNGVIIITTKRGKKGSAHINYDGYAGFQKTAKYLDMMNLKQYASLQNSIDDIYGLNRRPEFADLSLLGTGTNWQRQIFNTAFQQSHQVSVSGGNDGTSYYLSGGYMSQDGIVIGSNFKRYTLRSNIDAQVNEWFKIGISTTGSHSNERVVTGDNNGVIYNALLQSPDLTVTNPDGSYTGPPLNDPNAASGVLNPVGQALSLSNILNRSNINSNIYNEILLSKDLTLRSELGGDFNFSDNNVFTPTYTYGRFVNPTATLNERFQQSSFLIWKEYLTYNHKFNTKSTLNAVIGHEAQKASWRGTEDFRSGFYSNDVQTLNLGQAITATNDEYKGQQGLESAYARGIYTYNNKYSLTATIRADKSSKFPDGHQTGYFPSFAASWRISDEAFMSKIKTFADNIKLRLGYGQVGNQDVPNYLTSAILSPQITGLGTGFQIAQIPSASNLTWQTSIQYNAGLDFSILNGRIDASVDFYDKTSKNFLFQLTLPAYVVGNFSYLGGINAPYVNLGKLDNRGFDVSINSKNIATADFKWNTGIVFSHYQNTVKELAPGLTQLLGNVTNAYLVSTVTRTVVGGPIGEFYGYQVKGIFKTSDQLTNAPVQFGRPVVNNNAGTWLGDIQYVDVNHDGKIDENDRTELGNPNPKFTYGITNTFVYKAFDLNIFLNGSYGSKILNLLDASLGSLAAPYQNQYASVAGFWTPANATSNIPTPKSGLDNPNLKISDRFIQSGSYLRIQNVSLGWKVPSAWAKKARLSNLRVYASGQNLYTFTPYKGYDPELGAYNQNAILTNIDIGRYPIARTITFGVNAQF